MSMPTHSLLSWHGRLAQVLFLSAFICVHLWFPFSSRAAEISTFAGTGVKGYSGDGGPAAKAQLNNPYGLTRGPDGALNFCDVDNHAIRRIDKAGLITTIAGTGQHGYSGDGGPAAKAQLYEPYEIRFDAAGNIFFVERLNHIVRRIDRATGLISTVAGTGKPGFSGDGGPAAQAQLSQPHSIQFGPDGSLYICDIANHRIRRIDMKTQVISTFAGTGEKKPTPDGAPLEGTPLSGPRALAFDRNGDIWLALREGNAVYRIDMHALTIHHIAGTGKPGFTGNGGPAALATLSGPKGISIAPDGNVYLADTESHSIRMINPTTGTITLIAGTGQRGAPRADRNPLACEFARPHGIFVDSDGSIFIADSENHRLRVIR
jgi:streptogramin lyase